MNVNKNSSKYSLRKRHVLKFDRIYVNVTLFINMSKFIFHNVFIDIMKSKMYKFYLTNFFLLFIALNYVEKFKKYTFFYLTRNS